jgi:hypothetical protein
MKIEIKPYTDDRMGAVNKFNARLKAGRASNRFPEYHVPKRFPKIENRKIYGELFLALERDTVGGTHVLTQQEFSLKGQDITLAQYINRVSEGIVNKAYSVVDVRTLRTK